jgi:hypothetical protein
MADRAAPDTARDLAKQLSALLTDIDIAIRVRLRESARHPGGRPGGDRRVTRKRGAVVAALVNWWRRWELNPRPETLSRRRLRR